MRGSNGNFSQIRLNGDGNIFIESSQQITVKTTNISEEATSQKVTNTPSDTINASHKFTVVSPSIELNSSTGATAIKGKNSTYIVS